MCNLVNEGALLLKIRLLLQQLLIQCFTRANRFLDLDIADGILVIAASADSVRDSFCLLEGCWRLLERYHLSSFLGSYGLKHMMSVFGLYFFITKE